MSKKLQKDEQSIEDAADSFVPVSKRDRERVENAIVQARKDKTISLRISSRDLARLKDMAAREGLPYQSFVASILHRYTSNQLVDEKHIRQAMQLMRR